LNDNEVCVREVMIMEGWIMWQVMLQAVVTRESCLHKY